MCFGTVSPNTALEALYHLISSPESLLDFLGLFSDEPCCLGVGPSLKLTASLPLKMDGWNTIVSFWDGLFSGALAVSFRECITSFFGFGIERS